MLTARVRGAFDAGVQQRGRAYAAEGAVSRMWITNDVIHAHVIGAQRYQVKITLEKSADSWMLHPDCNCEYSLDHAGRCKHVWAVLVEVDRKNTAQIGEVPARVTVGLLDDGMERGLDDEYEDDPVESARPPRVQETHWVQQKRELEARRPAKQPPKKPPGWMNLLAQAPQVYYTPEEMKPPPRGELRYVVDIERSEAMRAVVVTLMTWPEPGKKAKPKRAVLEARHIPLLENELDRMICAILLGAGAPSKGYTSIERGSDIRSSVWRLHEQMLHSVMPLMQQTGRLFWSEDERSELRPLRWDGATGWELVIHLEEGERGAQMQPQLRRVNERQPMVQPTDAVIWGNPGAVLMDGVMSPLETYGSELLASWLSSTRPRGIQRADVALLLSTLRQKKSRVPVVWPESWRVREDRNIAPRGRLTFLAKSKSRYSYPRNSAPETAAQVGFEYGSLFVPLDDKSEYAGSMATADAESDTVLLRRDMVTEKELLKRLSLLGVTKDPYSYPETEFTIPTASVAHVALTLIRQGWEVRGGKVTYRRPGNFSISVSSGVDWFDVRGGVSFDNGQSAGIAALLEALKSGEGYVTLDDGSLGLLPEEWLKKHGAWLRLGKAEGDAADGLRFSRAQLGLIDALLAEMPEATCDAQVKAARTRLRAFDGVAARREPASFRGELREYQREGLGWLRFLKDFGFGGVLADDMGLGKTVQVLAHLAELKEKEWDGAWLVVAPRSLVYNWSREAAKFAPTLRVTEHAGLERRRRTSFDDVDLVVTTYGTLRRDVDVLGAMKWGGVVLDEAQAIKTENSQSAKAARIIGASANRRLALTGTPVENRLSDLWSIMEFLNPGMLGGATAFREAMVSGSGGDGTDVAMLRRAMRPFILRRTKEKVAPELPARSEQTIVCELSPAQRKLYDGVLAHYRKQLLGEGGVVAREGMNGSRMHVLEALLRLRQAACHTALLESKPQTKKKIARAAENDAGSSESAKLDVLMEMLAEMVAEGHRALVFSQFTSLLALVKDRLTAGGIAYEYLDGQTPAKKRAESVDRFQSGADGAPVFLISLKAGGVGLNLTAADYVVLLDPWWNPAVEAQAIDRAHRIGQARSVIAYRLIARGTVEEKIQELQASKRELAAAIVGEETADRNGPLAALTREELGWLLGT